MGVTEKGDGTMQTLLSQQRCPSCRSLMLLRKDDGYKRNYDCIVCGLKVVDVKESVE